MNSLPEWIIGILSFFAPGLGDGGATAYNGYVEAEYVYTSSAAPGRIVMIDVVEGTTVSAGDALFKIDDTHQITGLRAAEAQVEVAQANLENLQTGGRSAEIDVIRASLDQALADQGLAQSNLERSRRLLASGNISQARVDADRAAVQSANARVAQLQAQLQVAELPARSAQQIGAEAAVEAAQAQLDDARSALADRMITAPISGIIDKVFYDQGEVAGAGAPVVSILPPDDLKALFFVPESDRTKVQIGAIFDVTCSGCPNGLFARVTRLASTPQFTPPIIYSREEVSRLVFRAEARLVNAHGVLPGQPIVLTPRQ